VYCVVDEGDSTVSVPATKWKDCFLQAMLHREQTREEAKVRLSSLVSLKWILVIVFVHQNPCKL